MNVEDEFKVISAIPNIRSYLLIGDGTHDRRNILFCMLNRIMCSLDIINQQLHNQITGSLGYATAQYAIKQGYKYV